jgi:AbrB family looped-hinge helix DNA binding protein
MTTKLSTKGQVVLPASVRRRLALQAGDPLEISVENGDHGERIVIEPGAKRKGKWKIITDPLTGWPALKGPPGTPKLTSKRVKELLADFP